MDTIYKYPLRLSDSQVIKLPTMSKILDVDEQNGVLCLWAAVDTENIAIKRVTVNIVGTGNPIENLSELGDYISTVPTESGFVWHVFIKQ